ncbi:MAG: hypothetical protein IT546_05400, partial [Caulobacteraceae bacterium]|nr:hypothetical protein [Caulobacteraceae bacterium]
MPRPGENDIEFDAQDRAEAYDEDNVTEGDERRTFEEFDDVLDVTRRLGDAEDDEALDAGDYDPDDLGDEDLEEDENRVEMRVLSAEIEEGEFDDDDPGADSIQGLDLVADADEVEGAEDDFTNFQSRGLSDEDIERLGYGRASASPEPKAGHSAEDVEDRR